MKTRISLRDLDRTLFIAPICIFLIGALALYSVALRSHDPSDQALLTRQLLWMGVAVLGALLAARYDYFRLQDAAWPLYLATIVMLLVVLVMPARLGARRWIGIGPFSMQPSEPAKIAVILLLARFFANNRPEYLSLRQKLYPFAVTAIPFLLILKEPDLGTALLLVPPLFAMLYLWGFRKKHLFLMLLAVCVASPVLFHFLKDYQRARLSVFINPNADPLGAGYTIIQSKIAIGSGGLLGKGFAGGTQNYLNFLPERHTDFIFGVVAEEGGLFIGGLLILLFVLIAQRGFSIAASTSERFGSYLACGLTTLLSTQAVINLGMTMGLLPVVGVPLPLVSYGGTSLVMNMLLIALLASIKLRRPSF